MDEKNTHVLGSGWFSVPNHIWEENDLSLHEKAVLTNIMRRLGNDGAAFPSRERIGKDTDMSTRTVQRSLKSLTEKGCLISQRRKRRSSIYQLGHSLRAFLLKCHSDTSRIKKCHSDTTLRSATVAHIKRPTCKKTHHQEPTENSPDPENRDTADSAAELKKLKINPKTIRELMKNHPADRIETHITRYKEIVREAEHKGHERPGPGLLVQSIREDWQEEAPELDPLDDLPEDIRKDVEKIMKQGKVNLGFAKFFVEKFGEAVVMEKIESGKYGGDLISAFTGP